MTSCSWCCWANYLVYGIESLNPTFHRGKMTITLLQVFGFKRQFLVAITLLFLLCWSNVKQHIAHSVCFFSIIQLNFIEGAKTLLKPLVHKLNLLANTSGCMEHTKYSWD